MIFTDSRVYEICFVKFINLQSLLTIVNTITLPLMQQVNNKLEPQCNSKCVFFPMHIMHIMKMIQLAVQVRANWTYSLYVPAATNPRAPAAEVVQLNAHISQSYASVHLIIADCFRLHL